MPALRHLTVLRTHEKIVFMLLDTVLWTRQDKVLLDMIDNQVRAVTVDRSSHTRQKRFIQRRELESFS